MFFKLSKNIDKKGRLIRLFVAIMLLIYAIWQKSWVSLAFAFFVFFESFMSWCIVYQILGKSSCSIKKKRKKD